MRRTIFALAFLAVAWPAHAQRLTLQISDGLVTLEATSVPARQILAEWARVGGTKVVGAEKITGGPLTLHIVNMPERQALDIVLRNVAGFMAAPRLASATPGASAYDRIMILATSSAPAPAAATTARPANTTTTAGRRLPPRPPNLQPSPGESDPTNNAVEEPQQVASDDPADTGVAQPVFTFPPPPAPGNNVPVFTPVPSFGQPVQPGSVAPVITLQPNANGQPAIYNFVPANPNGPPVTAPASTPGFNGIGSPQPGMIQMPPQQQPAPPQRPPGQQ